mgnify:FL=1
MVLRIDATDDGCEIVIEVLRGVFKHVEAVYHGGELVVEDVLVDTSTYGVESDIGHCGDNGVSRESCVGEEVRVEDVPNGLVFAICARADGLLDLLAQRRAVAKTFTEVIERVSRAICSGLELQRAVAARLS